MGEFIDKVLHIDDPVGAISAHGVCGAFGIPAVGLFAEASYAGDGINGLCFGAGSRFRGARPWEW